MNKPKNQTAEVLYELLTNNYISRASIFKDLGILNLTARIANLRNIYGIDVKCLKIPKQNKHGRYVRYGHWYLEFQETIRIKEMNLYDKINR